MARKNYPRTMADAEPAVAEKSSEQRTELEALVYQALQNRPELWLEELRVAGVPGDRILEVVLDAAEGTEGLTLDEIGAAASLISDALDATGDDLPGLGTEPFNLEVTTPGVDRPLVRPYQWRRNLGRIVEVDVLLDPQNPEASATKPLRARIVAVNEDSAVELAEIIPGAKKGMRATEAEPVAYAFESLASAQVQVQLTE